jgi:uracil-DNA glycosylase family 4
LKNSQLSELNRALKMDIDKLFLQEVPLVYGSGDPEAGILLIGEAPGKNEVLQGKPFVGQAGKNLDEFIDVLQIRRQNLYITNVVKLRPYKVNEQTGRESNRPPTKKEIQLFSSYLMKEIGIVRPKLLVTLGNVALKAIIQNQKATIGDFHGKPVEIRMDREAYRLFPLYHLASILYKQDLKGTYLEDLQKLKSYIREHILV